MRTALPWSSVFTVLVTLACGSLCSAVAEGQLRLRVDDSNVWLQVLGDPDDDWRLQASSDLGAWTNLTDTDANFNAVLDSVTFGPQDTDRSYGRSATDADVWTVMDPTPGAANR